MSDEVAVQIIIVAGAVITTFLTAHYGRRIVKKKTNKPIDRIENIFDGYEKLISRQDASIVMLERTVDRLEKELDVTRNNLTESKRQNQELREQLRMFKREYKASNI